MHFSRPLSAGSVCVSALLKVALGLYKPSGVGGIVGVSVTDREFALRMEGSSGESVVPVPMTDSSQNGAGYENRNTEVVESIVEIEPEMYDFSSFLESDIVDDAFLEFKEMLESLSLPSSGHVVPEVVEELEDEKNMEQLVETPSTPPQQPEISSSARPGARLRWTKELHASFVDATEQLGGAFIATPKTIRDIMKVEGLSIYQVKSHLQKYRLGKNPYQNWKTFHKRGSLFSRALGGPSKPVASSQPPLPKNQCRRRAKPNKHEKGSLYRKLEVQRHLLRLLEAQRVFAKIAAERMASYTGKYPPTVNQNMRGLPFNADQNMGKNNFLENTFVGGATMASAATFNPYQLNSYNTYTSAAAINAGIFTAKDLISFKA